jgi:hypothetical protein
MSRKKWASRNLISVDDFGLGKGQDFLIFVSTSDSTMLALTFIAHPPKLCNTARAKFHFLAGKISRWII